MPDEDEFRIDYTILRRRKGEEDFSEIGFGSTTAHSKPDGAAYDVESDVQTRRWETSPGMPEPADV